jgi:hypothetical protein
MSIKKTLFAAMAAVVLNSGCDSRALQEGAWPMYLQVVRADAEHNRLWVLERDALSVHDNTNGRRLRRVALPDWIYAGAGYGCAPDLVIAGDGAALVSSNVMPVLWRIDPADYHVTRIELALESDADRDVGFADLQLASDGTLLAAGATFGSLWRIDLRAGRATKLAAYVGPQPVCDVATLARSSQEQTTPLIAASRPR